jgi:hypothetical protein
MPPATADVIAQAIRDAYQRTALLPGVFDSFVQWCMRHSLFVNPFAYTVILALYKQLGLPVETVTGDNRGGAMPQRLPPPPKLACGFLVPSVSGHMLRRVSVHKLGGILDAACEQMHVACLMPLRPRHHPRRRPKFGRLWVDPRLPREFAHAADLLPECMVHRHRCTDRSHTRAVFVSV